MNTTSKKKIYFIAILIPLALGSFSYFLTKDNMDIYKEIITPALAPPSILFPIVWIILYFLMGISSAMIFALHENRNLSEPIFDALYVYGLQLFLNFTWSIFFFNMRAFLFALLWIFLLWAAVLLMIIKFYKLNPPSAHLQIPYLLWVSFAAYLTFEIFRLNS